MDFLTVHFLPLLITERTGTQDLAAYAIWQTKSLEGRCSLTDITSQISLWQEPAPAPTSPGSPSHCLLNPREAIQPPKLASRDTLTLPPSLLASPPFSFPSDPWKLYKWLLLGPKENKRLQRRNLVGAQLSLEMFFFAFVKLSVQSNIYIPFYFMHMPLSQIIYPHLLFLGSSPSFYACS